jgi:hypothetical protein
MFEPKNLLILAIFAAVVTLLGYMLAHMIQPDPYAGTIVSHVESENGKAASQILATIKGKPKCDKLNMSRDSLLKYYKSQECFMLKTEMRTHRRPTDAELSSHGNEFITGLSSKLNMCMSPETQGELMARIEAGNNFKAFLDEIDRSKHEAGKLERISHKMRCSS